MTPLVLTMLRFVAGRPDAQHPAIIAEAIVRASPAEFQWALAAGLGPWLHAAAGEGLSTLPAERREALLGADLTARFRAAERAEAAADVIDLCLARGVTPTLLKGMSLAYFDYPEAHFRPMSDIDVLVPPDMMPTLERDALARGYRRADPVMEPGAHHAEPLYHPRTATKIELHSALFPDGSPLLRGTLFGRDCLMRHSSEHLFFGRRVRRPSAEYQLIYLASAWCRDLQAQAIDPGFVFGLFDAVTLGRGPPDWKLVVDLADCSQAAASLDVLLSYLVSKNLVDVPPNMLRRLRARHDVVGPVERRVLEWTVDASLVTGVPFRWCNSWRIWQPLFADGRPGFKALALPWYVAFPANDPARFDATVQARRWKRWMQRQNRLPH